MSVINQMLKDLEHRRRYGNAKRADILRDITYSSRFYPRIESVKLVVISVLFTVMLLLSFYLLWQQFFTTNNNIIQVTHLKTNEIKPSYTNKNIFPPSAIKNLEHNNLTRAAAEPKANSRSNNISAKQAILQTSKRNSSADYSVAKNNTETESVTEADSIQKIKREPNPQQKAEQSYQLAYQFLLARDINLAEESLRDALMFDPLHVQSRELLAGIYIKNGRLVEARNLLQYGIKFSPTYSVFAKLYARLLLEQGKLLTAIAVLQRQPPSKTTDPDYFALLAVLYQKTEQHQHAARVYSSLLKLQPYVGVWWLGLAISLESLGKNRQASQAYEKAKNSGNLASGLYQYSDQRQRALQDISFPQD